MTKIQHARIWHQDIEGWLVQIQLKQDIEILHVTGIGDTMYCHIFYRIIEKTQHSTTQVLDQNRFRNIEII
jgi:hypothetical protein